MQEKALRIESPSSEKHPRIITTLKFPSFAVRSHTHTHAQLHVRINYVATFYLILAKNISSSDEVIPIITLILHLSVTSVRA